MLGRAIFPWRSWTTSNSPDGILEPTLSIVSPQIETQAFSTSAGFEHGLMTIKFFSKVFFMVSLLKNLKIQLLSILLILNLTVNYFSFFKDSNLVHRNSAKKSFQ